LSSLVRIAFSLDSRLDLPRTSRHSLGAWSTIGATATILILLNLQTHAHVIVVSDKARITIERHGFPFPAVHRISTQQNPAAKSTETQSISFPNGAHLEKSKEKITTIRFGKRSEFPPADRFQFRDGTQVSFGTSSLAFILPNTAPIRFDLITENAAFQQKPDSYWIWLNALLNLTVAAALLLHSNSVGKRLFPAEIK
jgi:hypothetical protein